MFAQSSNCFSSFKKHLKTHNFSLAFKNLDIEQLFAWLLTDRASTTFLCDLMHVKNVCNNNSNNNPLHQKCQQQQCINVMQQSIYITLLLEIVKFWCVKWLNLMESFLLCVAD